MEEARERNGAARLTRRMLKRWEFWLGILGIAFTIIIVLAFIQRWQGIQRFEAYGYLGAFIISILGGATILAPIPMTPAIFALGSVMKPAFAPALGPVFVGLAAGLGETIGGITIYMTGYSSGSAVLTGRNARLQSAYARVMGWMERRGSLIIFVVSAVINPFFYPAAIAAGVLRFGLRRFILITWVGKSIKGISVAAAGYWGLGSLLRALGLPV